MHSHLELPYMVLLKFPFTDVGPQLPVTVIFQLPLNAHLSPEAVCVQDYYSGPLWLVD